MSRCGCDSGCACILMGGPGVQVAGTGSAAAPLVVTARLSDDANNSMGIGSDGGLWTPPGGPAGPGVPAGGTAGQLLGKTGAGDYETGWVDGPTVLYRASDSAGRSTQTAAADDVLVRTLAVGLWEIEAVLRYTASTTCDIKFSWAPPAGATVISRSVLGPDVATASATGGTTRQSTHGAGTEIPYGGSGAGGAWALERLLVNVVNAGTLSLLWARNAAGDGVAAVLQAGSYMKFVKLP